MWLYARHVIFFEHILLHKACIEGFCFEKNILKFVCWFYFRVLAVLYFLPWFQVTFWKGVRTMRKSANNAHLDDVHEMRLSRHGQWLLSFGNISILTDTQLEPQFLPQKTSTVRTFLMPKVLTVGVAPTNYEGRAIFLHTSNLVSFQLYM